MNAHTPGPWIATKHAESAGYWYVDCEGHDFGVVCTAWGAGKESDRAEADARLIAAAPDMYAALTRIFALDDGDAPYWWEGDAAFAIVAVRAAVAKAEGK